MECAKEMEFHIMSNQRKTTTITVDKETFDEEWRDRASFFNKGLGIPRGQLLSRAFYLLSREVSGEYPTQSTVEYIREQAEKNGKTFNEVTYADTQTWIDNIYKHDL